ncbi:alpha-L-fucosidase [Granulicella arctica]|uniref:alpha-L-fucosidase n=1 Tax=Granulicella arctica TaxID=940613 RepID=A0A7Y9PJ47_9BACT|nr:alpha-L-fucosidase [Granulicella arctica]
MKQRGVTSQYGAMRRTALILLLAFFALAATQGYAQNFSEVNPSPQQVEWQDLEFGAIIHFGPNTFGDREWGDGTASPRSFNPTQVDPEQWMRALKAAGVTYVVFVAKHHDGFCLWPTEQTDYSVKSSPWMDGKGDMVKLVSDAAHKYGLKFGVYLSPWDRHEPRYKDSAAYDKYYLAEMEELVQNYGPITEFWLDGAGSAGRVYNFDAIVQDLRVYQPNAIVFADTNLFEYGDARWVGNESGKVTQENWNVVDRRGYLRWRPAEVDTPLHKLHWFFHPNDEATLKSVPELLDTYEQSIGRGGQLMLGIAPDNRGLLPDADVARLEEFGEAIRQRYANNLVKQHIHKDEETERALDGDRDTFWSAPIGSHHSTLEIDFPRPVTFDHALTMEWLNDGQHVQQYALEVWDGTAWKPIVKGFALGHEKIDPFSPVTASRVRLNIIASSSEAHIREFQLYSIGDGNK